MRPGVKSPLTNNIAFLGQVGAAERSNKEENRSRSARQRRAGGGFPGVNCPAIPDRGGPREAHTVPARGADEGGNGKRVIGSESSRFDSTLRYSAFLPAPVTLANAARWRFPGLMPGNIARCCHFLAIPDNYPRSNKCRLIRDDRGRYSVLPRVAVLMDPGLTRNSNHSQS
jgi:hypothetical protein